MGEEREEQIRRALEQLPTADQQLIRLYHTDSRSYEEIADLTGIAEGQVKSRLSRARKRLKEMLGP